MTPIIWICTLSLCIIWHNALAAALGSINATRSQLMCLNGARTALNGSPSGSNAAASWRRALSAFTRLSASEREPAIQRADLAPYRVLKIIEACDDHANLTCKMDSTLPGLPKQRTFIAANLKESEDLMPHYVLQLLIAVSLLPKDQAYVSIYESGSHDNTGRWLQLLDDMLDLLDIRHDIVTGGMIRQGEERVAFLSKLRNAAIRPMQQGENGSLPEWPADRLLYINDVYFCAQDIVRLLQHASVSVVCAMDFWKHASRPDAPGHFYDVWVMRDVEGHRVDINPPYLHHAYSRFRLEQGLPFPVSCCWNGMISLDAQPFAEGLRFRAHRQHECQESEASQMCTDLFHLGRTDFIVDPGVRVAYEPQIAARANATELRIKQTTYRDIQEADPIDWAFTPQAFYRTCCDKSDYIDDADLSLCEQNPARSQVFKRRYLRKLRRRKSDDAHR